MAEHNGFLPKYNLCVEASKEELLLNDVGKNKVLNQALNKMSPSATQTGKTWKMQNLAILLALFRIPI